MQKSTSELLHSHWNRARGGKPLALRSEINPAEIRSALPFLFILEPIDGQLRFRLAGTHICAMFGQELRDHPFSSLWCSHSAPEAETLARDLMETLRPVYMNGEITLEPESYSKAGMLLLPLSIDGETCGRLIGALDLDLHRPADVGSGAVGGLTLTGASEPIFASGDDAMESLLSPNAPEASFHAAKSPSLI